MNRDLFFETLSAPRLAESPGICALASILLQDPARYTLPPNLDSQPLDFSRTLRVRWRSRASEDPVKSGPWMRFCEDEGSQDAAAGQGREGEHEIGGGQAGTDSGNRMLYVGQEGTIGITLPARELDEWGRQ
jgi:hypothetical protein